MTFRDLYWTILHKWLRFNEESYISKAGLNWSVTHSYFRVYWVSIDLAAYIATMYYIRLRWRCTDKWAIKLFLTKESWDLIEGWAFTYNAVVLSREQYSDLVSNYLSNKSSTYKQLGPDFVREVQQARKDTDWLRPLYPRNNEAARERDGKTPEL